jgi:hypothetical protein
MNLETFTIPASKLKKKYWHYATLANIYIPPDKTESIDEFIDHWSRGNNCTLFHLKTYEVDDFVKHANSLGYFCRVEKQRVGIRIASFFDVEVSLSEFEYLKILFKDKRGKWEVINENNYVFLANGKYITKTRFTDNMVKWPGDIKNHPEYGRKRYIPSFNEDYSKYCSYYVEGFDCIAKEKVQLKKYIPNNLSELASQYWSIVYMYWSEEHLYGCYYSPAHVDFNNFIKNSLRELNET